MALIKGQVAAAQYAGISRKSFQVAVKSGRIVPVQLEVRGSGQGRPLQCFATEDLERLWACPGRAKAKPRPRINLPPGAVITRRDGQPIG